MYQLVICIVLICLGAIALTLFLLEKVRKYSVKATMIKSVASLLFVSLGAYSWYIKGMQIIGLFFSLGLLVGLLGDIWLDFKYVFKEHDKPFTYAGFTMFAIGHVLYITGMALQFLGEASPLYIIIPILIGTVIGVANALIGKVMKLEFGKFKWLVGLYGSLLFSMTATALSLSILHQFQNTTLIMVMIGGVFFAISDLILSGTYFGVGKERPFDIISNAITYYAAQYIIAFSLFFL